MIYKIRKNVFETNSSSMHSICFNSDEKKLSHHSPFILTTNLEEYGWGFERLKTHSQKLSYIITSIRYHDPSVKCSKSLIESKYFKWLKEMVFTFSGSVIEVTNINDFDDYYVDHQSTDILNDFFSKDEKEFKENMKNIIFNDNCVIIIDNDNH